MSIINQSDENTVTLVGTLFNQTVNAAINITDLSRAEIIIDHRAAQSISSERNFMITARLFNDGPTTKITFNRGGSTGTVVCHYILKEYTVASGVVVHRGETSIASNPENILVPAKTRANTYCRVDIATTSFTGLQDLTLTHKLTTDTNLQVQGFSLQTGIVVSWQTVYIPDQTVFNVEASATGISFDIDITSLALLKDNTFCIQSMRAIGASMTVEELKGVELTTDTNLNVYSFASETHRIIAQLVYRPANTVQRVPANYSIVPFTAVAATAFVIADTIINICAPYNYLIPTDDTTDNAQEYIATSVVSSTTEVLLQKFIGGKTSKAVVEFVELGEATQSSVAIKWNYYRMMN